MFTERRLALEEESGLYYYRLRYYDPAAGRFISRDPLGLWGDESQNGNGQSYCGNNPINWLDPFGLWSPETDIGWTPYEDPYHIPKPGTDLHQGAVDGLRAARDALQGALNKGGLTPEQERQLKDARNGLDYTLSNMVEDLFWNETPQDSGALEPSALGDMLLGGIVGGFVRGVGGLIGGIFGGGRTGVIPGGASGARSGAGASGGRTGGRAATGATDDLIDEGIDFADDAIELVHAGTLRNGRVGGTGPFSTARGADGLSHITKYSKAKLNRFRIPKEKLVEWRIKGWFRQIKTRMQTCDGDFVDIDEYEFTGEALELLNDYLIP